jgi:hypothetical protein
MNPIVICDLIDPSHPTKQFAFFLSEQSGRERERERKREGETGRWREREKEKEGMQHADCMRKNKRKEVGHRDGMG